MKAILLRSVWSPTFAISTPSTKIFPAESSLSRNKACRIELLPAPVRPTIPTFIPADALNESSLMLGSRLSL